MHIISVAEVLPNVKVISATEQFKIKGHTVDMVPWDSAPPTPKGDVLMGHLPVIGAWMDGSKKHSAIEGLQLKELEGYKYVFLGHFHEFQHLKVKGSKFACYTGSIMQINLASSNMDRHIIQFKEDESLNSILIESPKISEIQISSQEDLDKFLKTKKEEDYYKIVIKKRGIEMPQMDHKIIIEYDLESLHEVRLKETPGENLLETINRFIDQSKTSLDKDITKKYLKELIEE
jgi:DNA repair exonuclease SbcCD nuclease subunit